MRIAHKFWIGILMMAARPAPAQTADPQMKLVGIAMFADSTVLDQPASLQMTVEGVGTIGDDCFDASAGRFIAVYAGELVPAPASGNNARTFEASLVPDTPAIYTPGGCPIHNLADPQVTSVKLTGWVTTTTAACNHVCRDDACRAACAKAFAIRGWGELTFQLLRVVDQHTLEAGAFDELWGMLTFTTPVDVTNRPFR